MNIQQLIAHYQTRIEVTLNQKLPAQNSTLNHAIRYAVLSGGKRLRPILLYLTGNILGASDAQLDDAACAIEFIHCYSLIHDDLPSMDDDDLRRGKPSCHIAFGEANAILAGDALQALAFELLAQSTLATNISVKCIQTLAQASSAMVDGQALDIGYTNQNIGIDQIKELHKLKTAALITAAIQIGAQIAGLQQMDKLSALQRFGTQLGLAFQIQNDLLDLSNNKSDIKNQKTTYATLLNASNAKQQLYQIYQSAKNALAELDEQITPLLAFSDYLLGFNQS